MVVKPNLVEHTRHSFHSVSGIGSSIVAKVGYIVELRCQAGVLPGVHFFAIGVDNVAACIIGQGDMNPFFQRQFHDIGLTGVAVTQPQVQ